MGRKVWMNPVKNIKKLNGSSLIVLVLVALGAIHFTIRIFELSSYPRRGNCDDEPIDIVYTWVNGSDPHFIQQMNKYLKSGENIDSSKQRYTERNELRFSLRSLEKYASWFNHIYLVTNGQIPSWLNLDCEKITVVTHEEIFKNQDNLPTFSSPAIESNLHRIPGLSKKFIYFNDDIFIGQPLHVDDFYVKTKGYSIFLTYIVPNCVHDCPWFYVGDGACDLDCYDGRCQFDGGDCDKRLQKLLEQKHPINSTSLYMLKLKQAFDKFRDKEGQNNITVTNVNNYSEVKLSNIEFNSENLHRRNESIAKLVDEHNKKVLVNNKAISKKNRRSATGASFTLKSGPSQTVDAFLESLLHTQRVFNKKYGFKERRVSAHVPIFIERDIMQKVEDTFLTEFEITEGNRFRHIDDMQFGFSYYYYLMSETVERSVGEIFDEFDTDGSLTWSDREIRTLLARIYEMQLPLTYELVDDFERVLLNCSRDTKSDVSAPPYERYVDSRLPTISKNLIVQCSVLSDTLKKTFGSRSKYQFRVIEEAETSSISTFSMLISNVTSVVMKLDEVRSNPTKFICLNDDMDESKLAENELIQAILYDFYLSLFPHPSKFELPENSRNRFLHVKDLKEWRSRHLLLQMLLYLTIFSVIVTTFFNVFKKVICSIFRGVCIK